MNTSQLLRAIRSDTILNQYCLGVFPRDRVPLTLDRVPCCLIVNTDPHNKPGSHWVLLYLPSEGIVEFFDSYGREPYNWGLLKSRYVVVTNKKQVQSSLSSVCGAHCLYVAFHRVRGEPMRKILDHYTDNPLTNDSEVVEFVGGVFDQSVPILSADLVCEQISHALSENQ